jgi:uncharacterized protein YndB with AHSA1/START domain
MDERTIEIVRVFDAPRERLWREWTEPERFGDWFGGPDANVPSIEMDVREGGAWRLTMEIDRRVMHWHGFFQEVEPPARMVFTITDASPEEGYHLITVELLELDGGRTEMRFEQRGPMPPEQVKAAGAGWGTFFDHLEQRLGSL